MRVTIGVWILSTACAARSGYVDPGRPETGGVYHPCATMTCGGSANPITVGLAVSALVGLTIATLWQP